MAEEALQTYLKEFLKHVIQTFGGIYGNRKPKKEETEGIQDMQVDAGFKVCAGCLE